MSERHEPRRIRTGFVDPPVVMMKVVEGFRPTRDLMANIAGYGYVVVEDENKHRYKLPTKAKYKLRVGNYVATMQAPVPTNLYYLADELTN